MVIEENVLVFRKYMLKHSSYLLVTSKQFTHKKSISYAEREWESKCGKISTFGEFDWKVHRNTLHSWSSTFSDLDPEDVDPWTGEHMVLCFFIKGTWAFVDFGIHEGSGPRGKTAFSSARNSFQLSNSHQLQLCPNNSNSLSLEFSLSLYGQEYEWCS